MKNLLQIEFIIFKKKLLKQFLIHISTMDLFKGVLLVFHKGILSVFSNVSFGIPKKEGEPLEILYIIPKEFHSGISTEFPLEIPAEFPLGIPAKLTYGISGKNSVIYLTLSREISMLNWNYS